jgi:succinylarginine dihydrolase
VSEAELPLADAIGSYLFNAMLIEVPGEDRLVLIAPVDVADNPRARAAAERIAASNGPIGRVQYVDVRESMRNGGGPACLRLRVATTPEELASANPGHRFTADLHGRLTTWAERHYRDRLSPADLVDPAMIEESRVALEALDALLLAPSAAA